MTAFAFSLGPWNDHGHELPMTLIGREVGGDAFIVSLHHDWESDTRLYGYWERNVFGKVFVRDVSKGHGGAATWAASIGVLRPEPEAAEHNLSHEERDHCIAKICAALAQLPDSDVRHAVPGAVLRHILFTER